MNDCQIAIMSYARPELLARLTIPTLDRHHADHDKIIVFVADQEQAEIYRQHVPDTIKIDITALGHFTSIREAHTRYPKDTRLLTLDDDIAAIEMKDGDKLATFDGTIDDLATTGFDLCERYGSRMWGIYPVRNAFYMADQAVVGLRYIVGCLWGTYAQDVAVMTDNRLTMSSGNDFETTLQSYRHHGSVTRLDYITVHTKYFADGGIDAELKQRGIDNRQTDHSKVLRRIAQRHAPLARIYEKADGVVNIRLKSVTHRRIPRHTTPTSDTGHTTTT